MTHSKLHQDASQVLQSLVALEDGAISTLSKGSIYSRLRKYFNKPDEALDPCTELNCIFSDLVSILQGERGYPHVYKQHRFSHVEQLSCEMLERDEILLERANAIRSLAVRAESRMELHYTKMLLLGDEFASLRASNMSYVEKIRRASFPFPYVGNYISMVESESKVISSFLEDEGKTKRYEKRELVVCFCGSGPLPLTGILLSICMDARVILVDIDEAALKLSMELVELWEREGVIPRGRISALHADCGDVYFSRGGSGVNGECEMVVRCDVVVVAALIPDDAKEKVAERISEMGRDEPLFVTRGAHGLTARFAYYQVRRREMSRHMRFLGVMAPVVHDLGDGKIVDDLVQPLGFFTPEILNSLEVYRVER